MYKIFFGLKSEPFAKSKKVDDLYKSKSFTEFINRMEYMKNHRGIFLLTGNEGTGKSTSLRYFMESLKKEFYHSIYINHSTVSTIEFYRQINRTLGGEWQQRKDILFKSIQELILDYSVNQKKIPVIVLDECQYMKNQNIYELQLLFNFMMDSLDPAILILSGQPHFKDRLTRPIFRSFYQRIHLSYELESLSEEETKNYIESELVSCGSKSKIFTEAGFNAVYRITAGNMRDIGKLCIHVLLHATQNKKDEIDQELIYEVNKYL